MKLMIAGCSFSAVSKTLPGTSWSEVLAKRLGWDLTNLARQGCSNGGIRIQIEEIRRQRPDFAVIMPTFWDRMEIPANSAPYDWNQAPSSGENPPLEQHLQNRALGNGGIRIQIEEIRRQRPDFAIITPTFWDRMEIPANSAPYDWNQAPSSGENPPLEQHLQNRALGNGYRREDGIRNVNYGTGPSNMICETIFTLAENFEHPYRMARITKQAQTGVRHWIDSIYDNAWKKQCDEWIMRDGITMMYLDGIRFIVCPNLLWPFDPNNSAQWRAAFPSIVPDHYINLDPARSPQAICGNNPFKGEDPGYHSSPAGQVIIAENFYHVITEQFGLK